MAFALTVDKRTSVVDSGIHTNLECFAIVEKVIKNMESRGEYISLKHLLNKLETEKIYQVRTFTAPQLEFVVEDGVCKIFDRKSNEIIDLNEGGFNQ
ncbi:hypothetical protein QTG56_24975 (plasmid) [Rossellomorea sp. AcN35-11]|nr:hypothetical protein [Rossellomorea aquimaris]WJV31887.1 hypothetical protein QTG56_24975 [Rossellomorea sp. AcN35-11]